MFARKALSCAVCTVLQPCVFDIFDLCVFAVKCQNATADAYRRASITCEATRVTGGVDVSIVWFRKDYKSDRVEEDETHQFVSEKHKGTLTFVQVGVYLFVFVSLWTSK